MKNDRIIISIIITIVVFISFLIYSAITISVNPRNYCCPSFIEMLSIAIYYIYIFLVAVLVILIMILFRNMKKLKDVKINEKDDKAIEILRERYAKGEISKEEYDKMLEDLKKK